MNPSWATEKIPPQNKTKTKNQNQNKLKSLVDSERQILYVFSHIGILDFNFYICVSLYVHDVVNMYVTVCACEYVFMGMSMYL